jgi:hypothetical protein
VKAPLDGGEWPAKKAGDPIERHVRPVAQRQDDLELFGQRRHGPAHGLGLLLSLQDVPAGLAQDLTVLQDQIVQRRVGGARLAAAPADHFPPCDRVQPRPKPGGVAQLGQCLEGSQECLLTDVFRQRP